MHKKKRHLLNAAIVFVAATLAILSGRLMHIVDKENQTINRKINDDIHQKKKQIETYLSKIEATAEKFANDIRDGKIPKKQIIDYLKRRLSKESGLFEMAAVFAPYKFSDSRKLFGPYFVRKDNALQLMFADTLNGFDNDYTEKKDDNKWYTLPMTKLKGIWVPPYYDEYTKELLVEYSTPFYLSKKDEKQRKPAGVICSGIAFDHLRNEIQSMDFGKTGYAVLVSRDGKIIYHPLKELSEKLQTLQDLASESKHPELMKIAKMVRNGDAGRLDFTDIVSKKKMLAIVEPFETLGVSIICFCSKDELAPRSKICKEGLYTASFIGVVLLTLILFKLFPERAWLLSIGSTAIFSIGVIAILLLYGAFEGDNDRDEISITSYSELNHYIHRYIDRSKTYSDTTAAILVPTGIFLQSIDFSSANDFEVTGYVWQRYRGKYDEETGLVHFSDSGLAFQPGIVFPENKNIVTEKAYVKHQGLETVIGWYFNAKIRERFDYSEYPFDRELFWIRMWHREFDKNVVLTPDFNAYTTISPQAFPGLEEDLVLPGWSAVSSYFTYVEKSYNANFGISDYVGQYDFPELHFNVSVRRKILDTLISDFVPIIVVLFMLFSILMLGRKSDSNGSSGFNSLASVSACSALFFVVIFNHINMRKEMCVPGIVYMEFFYFVTYLLILYVSVNSIAIIFYKNKRFFCYGDNLISRLIFWPIASLVIYILTFVRFF
ncbi:MAG: Cache 3/Cache 2 fusion domain-containing protein [Deltaproteobacteria bacterium]|nr:Cache 3/Cache 2 fusion domain-containing protein [Deltaproteobacteria bacterium]